MCAAVQRHRSHAEGRAGLIKTREEGATIQYLPAGRGQAEAKRRNTAP